MRQLCWCWYLTGAMRLATETRRLNKLKFMAADDKTDCAALGGRASIMNPWQDRVDRQLLYL